MLAVTDRKIPDSQHIDAKPREPALRRGVCSKIDGSILIHRLYSFGALEHFAPRLCLFGLLAGDVTPYEFLSAGYHLLLLLILFSLDQAALFALGRIGCIGARIDCRLPFVDLDDLC